MLDNSLFPVRENDSLSPNIYNLFIGLTLLWGFFVNFLMVLTVPVSIIQTIPIWLFLVGYFAIGFLGVFLTSISKNSWITFLGYNLIVIPFGLIINICLQGKTPGLVLNSIMITGIVTIVMMFASTCFPCFFKKISWSLTLALLVTIVVELGLILVTGHSAKIIDWIVIILFCGYIGFDWAKANSLPKTVNNAVFSAASLYMDIINIFLRTSNSSSK